MFFFTSGSSHCTHKSVKDSRMEGELLPRGQDSMLLLPVGRHSGNVLPFGKLLVPMLGWRLNLSFNLYRILSNDKIMPPINVLYMTVKERCYAGNMIN